MEIDLETSCDTPGCRNRVRRYPWNSDHRHETRYCIPCALERQQRARWSMALDGDQVVPASGKELRE